MASLLVRDYSFSLMRLFVFQFLAALIAAAHSGLADNARLIFWPDREPHRVSLVEIDLESRELTFNSCEPSLPQESTISVSQWGQVICVYPPENQEVKDAISKASQEWREKYNIDVFGMSQHKQVAVDGRTVEGEVTFFALAPQQGAYATLIDGLGMFVFDASGAQQNQFLEKGVCALSWDSSGRYLAFAREVDHPNGKAYCAMLFDLQINGFITLLKPQVAIQDTGRPGRPIWHATKPAVCFTGAQFQPSCWRWSGEGWDETVPFSAPFPGTDLVISASVPSDRYLSGSYLMTWEGVPLVRLPRTVSYLQNVIWLKADLYIARKMTFPPPWDSLLVDESAQRTIDIPNGQYRLLNLSTPKSSGGPQTSLQWLVEQYPQLTFDKRWNGACVVYPVPPPFPAEKACEKNRNALERMLNEEFARLANETTTRNALWSRYDGTALLKDYLKEHPELRCPDGGTYSAGRMDKIVQCSKHPPGQHHD